jgi:hypothetical protein
MHEDIIKKELSDYFLGRGRFKGGAKLVGMSGSQYPNYFLEYFQKLILQDKKDVVQFLIRTITGHYPEFSSKLLHIMSLVNRLAIAKQYDLIQPHQEILEHLFLDKSNLQAWAGCDDTFSEGGKEYLLSWRFPLTLFCILKYIGSTEVDKGYDFLIAEAKLERFREALQNNRAVIVKRL